MDYYVAVTYGEEDLIERVWDDFQDILKWKTQSLKKLSPVLTFYIRKK